MSVNQRIMMLCVVGVLSIPYQTHSSEAMPMRCLIFHYLEGSVAFAQSANAAESAI